MTLAPDVKLGVYQILSPLGSGGMGEVYRARDTKLGRDVDPLTGARRDEVLVSAEDAERFGVSDGAPLRLRSAFGVYDGRARIAMIKPGNLEVHWPEGNTLLSASAIDPDSMEPDYNAVVTLARVE